MQPSTDPALNQLIPALNRLKEPWISEFFNPTSEQHLSQLEHALNNQTLTGHLHLSPSSTPFHNESPNLTFIFAPSFSTGSITVGFDLTHRAEPANPIDFSPQRSVSRVVRDDSIGIFLSVNRLFTHTEIALSRITSNGRSMSLTSLTNTAYDALLADSASIVSSTTMETLNSGVLSTLYAEDSISPSPCAKLHPMDFAAEQRNVECFVHGFHSVAQLKEYNEGNLVGTDWCFARMDMDITRQGVFVKDMRDWAIQQAVRACRIRVPGLCVPGLQIDHGIDDVDMGIVHCTGKVADFRPDDIVKILAGFDDHLDDPLFDGNNLALMNGDHENEDATSSKEGQKAVNLCQNVTSKSTVTGNSTGTSTITETPPQTSVSHVEQKKPNPSKEGHSSLPQSRKASIAKNRVPELAPKPSPANTHVIEHILPRRAVPIAPADVDDAERSVMTESQRKEERRRARNRASALRSNEKKRLYLKKLKEDIAAAAKQEMVLRERERRLREKNWELRIALRQ